MQISEITVLGEIAVLLAIAGGIINIMFFFRGIRREIKQDYDSLIKRIDARFDSIKTDQEALRSDVKDLRSDVKDLRSGQEAIVERISRVEGMLEGIMLMLNRRAEPENVIRQMPKERRKKAAVDK